MNVFDGIEKKVGVQNLNFPLKGKYVAMLAPSFVVDFEYPSIISRLKALGFDKVVELTFGAKMVNREYQKQLKKSKKLLIASPCPGIVEIIKQKAPKYAKNLAQIDSPVTATGKICRKIYPNHKLVFISPCHYKKLEVANSKYIDYTIDYKQLNKLFVKFKVPKFKTKSHFDKFYNDYTKIYPVSGGLGKTAHLKGVIKQDEILVMDGLNNILKFLQNPDQKKRFLDILFCKGRRKKVLDYLEKSKDEDIPDAKKGVIDKAKGINFLRKV